MAKRLILPLCALLLGCDAPEEVDPIEFRNGPPEVWYIPQDVNKIDFGNFMKLIMQCTNIEIKPRLAVTWSVYPVDENEKDVQVMGFGFSMKAHKPLVDCYRDMMVDHGAVLAP